MIRPARIDDAFAISHVHVTSWRETYPGLVPATFLERLSASDGVAVWAERILSSLHDPRTVIVVATGDDGAIVGFASGHRVGARTDRDAIVSFDGAVRCEAELAALYVLRAAHGRGIGRALFEAVCAHFRERGWVPFGLWVLAGNPAEGFYRRLGGAPIAEKHVELEGAVLAHVAFAYR